ncbi:MAG TPA: hypothetical protein VHB50_00920 [Bryobacteraceae bacterium]|nr:hypothetical protein [Bryobacteraceae bacterium]
MGLESNYTSANVGGIKRGDSAETGDLEAKPTETADRAGSGAHGGGGGAEGEVTADASALGTRRGETPLRPDGNELDELTVKDAHDPSLGLTDIDNVPPEDWAADTGPTRSEEEVAPSRRR